MAQESRDGSGETSSSSAAGCTIECSTPFKFNVHAPEFVPRTSPAAGYFSAPFMQLSSAGGGIGMAADWSFLAEPEPAFFVPDLEHVSIGGLAGGNVQPKGASPADIAKKIIKQVEYQFGDTNLIANDFLMKIMNKDPEGYVPMSVISSWKKIKAMGVTNQLLVKALRTSAKLVVSDDGQKVRRAQPFTERHKEELQSQMVIVENLPDDSTRNSLEKIFGTIGSVKNIRICHPQEPSSVRSSKSDALVSSKVLAYSIQEHMGTKCHALIEYETSQQAEKAVDKLNDERNWRRGLRVRTVLRRSPKSVIRLKRPSIDHLMTAGDEQSPQSLVSSDSQAAEHLPEHHPEDHHGSGKKPWGRGRGRPHVAALPQTPHSAHAGVARHFDSLMSSQHAPLGPRMPDGTRGFTMGRGRPSPAGLAAVMT